ncbi:hypothetical protein NNL21_20120 [Paenibacillus mendelii]|nr:hypothetical protein [Paenibacillus mendelii]
MPATISSAAAHHKPFQLQLTWSQLKSERLVARVQSSIIEKAANPALSVGFAAFSSYFRDSHTWVLPIWDSPPPAIAG